MAYEPDFGGIGLDFDRFLEVHRIAGKSMDGIAPAHAEDDSTRAVLLCTASLTTAS